MTVLGRATLRLPAAAASGIGSVSCCAPVRAGAAVDGRLPFRYVVIAADIQMLIGSGMPLVLAIGFGAILLLRRRDRRRSDSGDE